METQDDRATASKWAPYTAPVRRSRFVRLLSPVSPMKAWAALITATATAIVAISSVATAAAGPGERARDSVLNSLAARADALEAAVPVVRHLAQANAGRIDTLYENQRFQSYMLCVLMRRGDQSMLPPGCQPILSRWEGRR